MSIQKIKLKGSIIIVDDNTNVLNALRILLSSYFQDIYLLSSPNTLISVIRDKKPDIALLDMNYSTGINTGNEGFYWLNQIKKQNPNMPVILFTAYADIELAVRALKEGATDFIVKPWDNVKLISSLRAATALSKSQTEAKITNSHDEEIHWGDSKAMQDLLVIIKKVAKTDANILITGENGTGKEIVANILYQNSKRHTEPLVSVDMGAIAPTLFESELFGHTKGAFTDAHSDRVGKFESANKGTLFLDEIGNLDLSLQSKLLSALQSRKIVRVGSNKQTDIDVRLICATNSNLTEAVSTGKFREDLLYRVNTIHLEVPALRNRQEDIPRLATFFAKKYAQKYNKENITIADEALQKLQEYAWPGNVRELQHVIEKAIILSDNNSLNINSFHLHPSSSENISEDNNSSITIEEMEKQLIIRTMKKHDNNISTVANELGISRPTLYSKLKKYRIE